MDINVELFYLINNGLANPFFDFLMPVLSDIGGFVSLLGVSVAVTVVLKLFKKEKYLKTAKMCLYALAMAGIIAAALKLAIQEPRPFTVLDHVKQLAVPVEPNSFPSGHTASTLSIITVLICALKKQKMAVGLLAVFGFLVAFSRIYVGVHYPLDVIAGGAVGVLSGVVVFKLKN